MEQSIRKRFQQAVAPFLAMAWLVAVVGIRVAAAESDKLFPPLPGWEQPDEIDVYDPDSLWDIINGAADLFMAYDFRELSWGRYTHADGRDSSIVVEIYRQGDPVNAFGAYSQERPRPPRLLDIGAEGFAAPGALHFIVSDLYVRMRSHDLSEETAAAMERLARRIAGTVDSAAALPDTLGLLPEEGKEPFSEQYINRNFLGHPFLGGAFVAGYEMDGSRFNLFVIESESSKASRQMLADYYAFSRQSPEVIAEGIHRIADRWNGEVGIVWSGNFLYGYYNLEIRELQQRYLDRFSGRASRH